MLKLLVAVSLAVSLAFAGAAEAQSSGKYRTYQRGSQQYISLFGAEYRFYNPPPGITFDIAGAFGGIPDALADSGCTSSGGLYRPERPNRRLAMRGFLSFDNDWINAMSFAPDGHVAVYFQHPSNASGMGGFIPRRMKAEFNKIGYERSFNVFHDFEAIFLFEERYEHNWIYGCRYVAYVTDYIPLGAKFQSQPIFDDAMVKLEFGLDVLELALKMRSYQ